MITESRCGCEMVELQNEHKTYHSVLSYLSLTLLCQLIIYYLNRFVSIFKTLAML